MSSLRTQADAPEPNSFNQNAEVRIVITQAKEPHRTITSAMTNDCPTRMIQVLFGMVEIPESPIFEFAQIKLFGSGRSLFRMQTAVNFLTTKAQTGQAFTKDEKEFLVELFEAFGIGGRVSGFSEASELVANYIHGNGKTIRLDEDVYRSSAIVGDVIAVMKRYVQDVMGRGRPANILSVSSSDANLLRREDFRKLMSKSRGLDSKGRVLTGGWLWAEQSNQRLQKANNRFILQGITQMADRSRKQFSTRWRVDDDYSFEPFSKKFSTEMHVRKNMILVVPDGLSKYMCKLGLAKEFNHFAEWVEPWTEMQESAQ